MMGRLQTTLLVAAIALGTGCTVNKTEAPPPSGPSELSTAITLRASPDTLPLDGSSTSQVTIETRDANGQPVRSLGLRADIMVNGVLQDFGELSAKTLTTGGDGKASVVYRAPNGVAGGSRETTISVMVTPIGTDARDQNPRTVDIRLVPTGVITPPPTIAPDFTITPETAAELETVTVVVDPNSGEFATYSWSFGDGGSGTGRTVQHQYRDAGTYPVTLTVTDFQGRTGSRTKLVTITQNDPKADFVVSPSDPALNGNPSVTVFFDAATSTAGPGRRIVSYQWRRGADTFTGVAISMPFTAAGTYSVTLTVTDDAGNTNTASKSVTVDD